MISDLSEFTKLLGLKINIQKLLTDFARINFIGDVIRYISPVIQATIIRNYLASIKFTIYTISYNILATHLLFTLISF